MPPRRRPPVQRPSRRSHRVQNKVRQMLQRAHRLIEEEEYLEAAEIFERLAQGARQRRMLQRAPRLFLQAGRTYILAGNMDQGTALIRQGLKMLARTRQWTTLQRAGERVAAELTEEGYADLAQEFSQWLEETLPDDFEAIPRPTKKRSVTLPLKCPSCGAPIRSDEVEWVDRTTAVCPYCGSGLRGAGS